MRPLRRRRLAALLGLALLVAAPMSACAVTAPTPTPAQETAAPADEETAGLPEGVTAALLQLRGDVAARQAQLEVRNDSEQPVVIGAVAVRDPRFTEDATRVVDKTTRIAPGGRVNIRVQLPEVACGVTDGASTVALTFLDTDTVAGEVRTAPLPNRLDFLAQLYDLECRAQALADAATVRFASFEPSAPGAPAALGLEIDPTGDAGALIAAIQSTNLLTFGDVAGRSYPIDHEVTPGETSPTIVSLPLVPFRCDPHAVQEDKRGTVFHVEVEQSGESGLIQVAADEDMRGRILTWVADWCGFGQG